MDSDVRAAIAELRSGGLVIVVVTGRILEDLRRVAGDLHFVDAVVAENGAVIAFPASGSESVLGSAPSPPLLQALDREGIRYDAGRVVVEAGAGDAPRLLRIIQRLELPLSLAFNRGHVMVLPQAISKATGLRQALAILRLSPHNCVALGDAENDHELLRACELGVAVGWGSEALKAAADVVLEGEGPAAVAGYLRDLARDGRVPAPVVPRRRLHLGYADDGREVALAVRGRNVLVAGDPKSGKSWAAGLLCEQLILHGYSLCLLDPEGDYVSLEALPGVRVFGGADPLPRPRDLLRALRHADVSVVVDLSHVEHDEKVDYLRAALPALARLRQHTGLPHRIVVDEAHYFLHDVAATASLDFDQGGYTLISYRPSTLHPDLARHCEAVVVTRESDPAEVGALHAMCGLGQGCGSLAEWGRLLGSLVIGEAVVLPITAEAEGMPRRIRLAPRLTPHVRHLAKYIDVPVPERRAFVFWRNGSPRARRARTLREFVAIVGRTEIAALDGHLQRNDFSRWFADVFGDFPLAEAVREIEEEYRRHPASDVATRVAQAVRARYDFLEPVPPPGP
ncbi:MAG: HAD hydrolase family protein [Acidobacteriota bacterium]